MAKYATRAELGSVYSIDDLFDFHEAIDLELAMNEPEPSPPTRTQRRGKR